MHVSVTVNGMNSHNVEGSWKQLKGKARVYWGRLTDNRLDVIAGKRVALAGKVQRAYGEAKDKAEHQIKRVLHEHNKHYRAKRSS